jgi:hypothetical protein
VTKYILAGGNDRDSVEYGQNLTAEILKTLTGDISVLSCFFSQPNENWQERISAFEPWFRENLGQNIRYVIASEAAFLNQIREADVIYLHGGDDDLLIGKLKNYPTLAASFKNKIVIGSSAGAISLAKKSWSCDSRTIVDGLGLVPTNTIVHFDSDYALKRGLEPIDWKKAEAELRTTVGPDEKISRLKEGNFEVFTDENH